MITVTINGEETSLEEDDMTILSLLKKRNLQPQAAMVRVNDSIVEKGLFDRTLLKEGDAIEFLDSADNGYSPKIAQNVLELIGNTPIVKINKMCMSNMASIYGKLESFNPGGSIKDRICLSMIEDAEERGLISPGATIVEPTSGNTGIGLAIVAAVRGYNLILTMPDTMSEERIYILKAYGAEVVLTPGYEGMAGAVEKAEEIVAQTANSFMQQQFKNPATPDIHRKTTAQEILEATDGKLDAFVAGVGTGGTLTGIGTILKEIRQDITVVAVEPASCAVLSGGQPGPHMIQGIGAGFIPDVLDMEIIDQTIRVEDAEAFSTSRRLSKEEGLFVGVSAGAAMFAALKVADEIGSGKLVVVILPDKGERYFSAAPYFE